MRPVNRWVTITVGPLARKSQGAFPFWVTALKARSKSAAFSLAPTSFAMSTKRLWRSASVSLDLALRGDLTMRVYITMAAYVATPSFPKTGV